MDPDSFGARLVRALARDAVPAHGRVDPSRLTFWHRLLFALARHPLPVQPPSADAEAARPDTGPVRVPEVPRRTRGSFLVPVVGVLTILVALPIAIRAGDGHPPSAPGGAPSAPARLADSAIAGRATLRIGVYEDAPLMGFVDGDGTRSGFEIDLARALASFLGFGEDRIAWIPLTAVDRVRALRQGEVDLVVASLAITGERSSQVRFAGPYLITSPEVMVARDRAKEITELGDLRAAAEPVCVAGGSVAEAELAAEGITVQTVASWRDCVDGILGGRVVAASANEVLLGGFVSQHPDDLAIVDMPFAGSEQLGIGVSNGDPALQDVVGYFLMRNYEDARAGRSTAWSAAYADNLGRWLGPAGQPYPDGVPDLDDEGG